MSTNDTGTSESLDTRLTQADSRPVRYELIDAFGEVIGIFVSAQAAVARAHWRWPDQEQDENRTGKGWDIQVSR